MAIASTLLLFIINRFEWQRIALIYDTPAYNEQVGASGGFLLASTIHDYLIYTGFSVLGKEISQQQTYEELLIETVGNNYASELLLGTGSGLTCA